MKKIPVTGCHDCFAGDTEFKICLERGNIGANIGSNIKSKTFHPDCKLEDDDWQEMGVLPPLKKGDTETTNTVLIKHDWRDVNEQPDYYTGCYWYESMDYPKNVKFNKAWRVYGDENDYHRKRIKSHPEEYQWKTI